MTERVTGTENTGRNSNGSGGVELREFVERDTVESRRETKERSDLGRATPSSTSDADRG